MTKFSTAQEPVDPSPPTGVDPVRLLAGVLAAGSVIFTGWKIWDLIAGPGAGILMHGVGVASGLAVESAWLMLLALAHQQATRTGHVSRWVTIAGWVLAVGAAGILFAHGVQSGAWVMALLGVLPLMAKTAWHGLTHSRALETLDRNQAAEQARAEADRIELEREQEAARAEAQRADRTGPVHGFDPKGEEFTQIRRQAAYARAKAQAESELTTAQADADRERQQAEAESERIRRQAESALRQEAIQSKTEEELAVLEANARLVKRRQEVEVELELTRPYALPTGAGPRVPDDASSISPDGPTSTSVAGFGAGLSELRAQGGGIGRAPGDIGSDLVEHPSRPSRVAGLAVRVATLVLTRANVLRTTPRVWRPVAAPASGSWSRSPTQVPACPTPNWPAFWGSAAPRCVITATPCGMPVTGLPLRVTHRFLGPRTAGGRPPPGG